MVGGNQVIAEHLRWIVASLVLLCLGGFIVYLGDKVTPGKKALSVVVMIAGFCCLLSVVMYLNANYGTAISIHDAIGMLKQTKGVGLVVSPPQNTFFVKISDGKIIWVEGGENKFIPGRKLTIDDMK